MGQPQEKTTLIGRQSQRQKQAVSRKKRLVSSSMILRHRSPSLWLQPCGYQPADTGAFLEVKGYTGAGFTQLGNVPLASVLDTISSSGMYDVTEISLRNLAQVLLNTADVSS